MNGVPASLESGSVGLEDRDALRVLYDAFNQEGSNDLVRRFYTDWFSHDVSTRDLFPPEMASQRAAFAQALRWVYGELVEQRADEPVAFLAQLGRDHRKYGVLPGHYDTLRRSLYVTLRSELGDAWTDAVEDAASQSLNLITGVMSGAADAEEGPAWWDATVAEHIRVSRDLAVIRLRLDRPMHYHAGQYLNVHVPQCPRRWRYLSPAIPANPDGAIEFHVRVVPGGFVSTAIVGETRPGDHWRLSAPLGALRVDRDGGDVLMVAGSTGLAPLRALIMDLTRYAQNPRVHLFFGARYRCELYDLRTLWHVVGAQSVAVGVAGVGVQARPVLGRRLSRRHAPARSACTPNRPAARGGDQVRRLERPADPDLRRTGHGPCNQGRSGRQRHTARTYSARSPVQISRGKARHVCTSSPCATHRPRWPRSSSPRRA